MDSELLTTKPDIKAYIESTDAQKRAAVENGAEPTRYHEARKQKGLDTFQDLYKYFKELALDQALEKHGMSKTMTQARREGTIKKPPVHMVKNQYQIEIINLLNDHVKQNKVIQPEEAFRFQKDIQDLSLLKGKP